MKIRYVGTSDVRIIGEYRWDASNGFVQDVTDPEILENLLTYPKPDFEAVETYPGVGSANSTPSLKGGGETEEKAKPRRSKSAAGG